MVTSTRPSAAHVLTPPGNYFYDPGLFALEQQRIFSTSWVCVGLACKIEAPGAYFLAEVGGQNILVLRDREGVIRAFYNACRHRGARLCPLRQGTLNATIQCRYHAWTYGLDGRLVGAPNMHDEVDFDPGDFGLVPVHVQLWQGLILVNLSAQPGSLSDQQDDFDHSVIARYHIERLGVGGTLVYNLACNWKIAVANYQECAHCALVHPELSAKVPTFRAGYTTGGLDYGAEFTNGVQTLTPDGTTARPPLPGLLPEDHHKYYGIFLQPNLFLDFQPDYVVITIMEALAPDRTRLTSDVLFDRETMAWPDFDPTDAIEFTDLVSKQDGEVCELTQLGVQSAAFRAGGIYGPNERHIREFDDYVLRAVGWEDRG